MKQKRQGGNDVPVATSRTDRQGRNRVDFEVEHKTYYAQIRGENRGPQTVPCKGDRSLSITFAEADPAAG